ncbi:MAG: transglutaminase domain-containing protein [Bacteroidota bacterium]
MKRLLSFVFCLFIIINLSAQTSYVEWASKAHWFARISKKKLAKTITRYSKTDYEKAHALHIYVAKNIKIKKKSLIKDYDKKLRWKRLFFGKIFAQNFNSLYLDLCKLSNLDCFMAIGYGADNWHKKDEPFIRSVHNWPLVKINNEWKLIDPFADWGEFELKFKYYQYIPKFFNLPTIKKGVRLKYQYSEESFLIEPNEYIKNSIPVVPYLQLLQNTQSLPDFQNKNWTKNTPLLYNYNDSISEYYNNLPMSNSWLAKGAKDFNFHNNFELAEYLLKESNWTFNHLPKKINDTTEFIETCNKLLLNTDSTKQVLKLHEKEIKEFIKLLFKNNDKYHAECTKIHEDAIKSCNKQIEQCYKTITSLNTTNQKLKNQNKALCSKAGLSKKQEKSLIKQLEKAKPEKIQAMQDTLKNRIKTYTDSITTLQNRNEKITDIINQLTEISKLCYDSTYSNTKNTIPLIKSEYKTSESWLNKFNDTIKTINVVIADSVKKRTSTFQTNIKTLDSLKNSNKKNLNTSSKCKKYSAKNEVSFEKSDIIGLPISDEPSTTQNSKDEQILTNADIILANRIAKLIIKDNLKKLKKANAKHLKEAKLLQKRKKYIDKKIKEQEKFEFRIYKKLLKQNKILNAKGKSALKRSK